MQTSLVPVRMEAGHVHSPDNTDQCTSVAGKDALGVISAYNFGVTIRAAFLYRRRSMADANLQCSASKVILHNKPSSWVFDWILSAGRSKAGAKAICPQ